MARGLPITYGPSRTAPKSSTARAMGVNTDNTDMILIWIVGTMTGQKLIELDPG